MSNAFEKTWISGDAIPRRGNWFSRTVGSGLLWLAGWKPAGQLPNLSKFIVVAAPHTSNWDGVLAVLVLWAAGLNIHWMVKREVLDNPFSGILRWLGAIPVDRQSPVGLVDQIVERFTSREKFIVVITPEGTRKRVEKWKTGFYRIAMGANVPIVLAYADYPKRTVGIGPTLIPTGNLDADLARMMDFFKTVTPRHPDRA
ncbi:MAG: lysophospholipid acyltransferase family protein [Caldilineaceae bacterium]|nr:lysophospholipid acyltransferase family protein [Caldilineaceae bacterium]